MEYLSICSGIEAATVAWEPLGWKAVAYAEIEKFPAAVLAHHYPNTPNLGDMTKIDGREYHGAVDVFVGGTPCQAFSVAGLRAGLVDPRGSLTLTFAKLADDMQPPYIVWENVPGVLSSKDNAFGCFLGLLAGEADALVAPGGKWTDAGFVLGPQRAIAWRVLDAQYFGLAQRRRRVFLVACPRGGADPREILFEREGVRRDSPPSRETGQGVTHDVAPCIGASDRGFERGGDTRWQDPVVACLNGLSEYNADIPTLRAKGGDCSGGSEALCFGGNNTSGPIDVATARSASGSASGRLDFESETFAVSIALRGREGGGACEMGDDKAYALMQVRRLTPRECERLQGFPNDYTMIPWRGKESVGCPDGPRYKALGNSFAVPVVRWLGERIAEYEVKHGRYQSVFSSQTLARRRG